MYLVEPGTNPPPPPQDVPVTCPYCRTAFVTPVTFVAPAACPVTGGRFIPEVVRPCPKRTCGRTVSVVRPWCATAPRPARETP